MNYTSGSQSVVPGAASPTSLGNLFDTRILRLHSRSTESETLDWGAGIYVLMSSMENMRTTEWYLKKPKQEGSRIGTTLGTGECVVAVWGGEEGWQLRWSPFRRKESSPQPPNGIRLPPWALWLDHLLQAEACVFLLWPYQQMTQFPSSERSLQSAGSGLRISCWSGLNLLEFFTLCFQMGLASNQAGFS